MTEEEIICRWAEPAPGICVEPFSISRLGWWKCRYSVPEKRLLWYPHNVDSLDRLHEVEARLTDEQWEFYLGHLQRCEQGNWSPIHRRLVHASAEQKIKAMAAVLREEQP